MIFYEKKYYLQVYLDNCDYKIVDEQMNLDDHPFTSDEN